jgi:hypothetical protein
MTWNAASQRKIAFYLGFPINSETYSRIATAQARVLAVDADAVAVCEGFIAELEQLETEIEGSRDNDPADIFEPLKVEARRWVLRLSTALDLEVNRNVF